MCQSMSMTSTSSGVSFSRKPLHQLIEFLVAVGPVARPPRAEGKPRRQRNAAGDAHIIAQRLR